MAFALSDMKVWATAFELGAVIPDENIKEGENRSPELCWENPPEETRGFAVFCHDPDAPLIKNGRYGFVHWLIYNLPKSTTSLDEGTKLGSVGKNDFDEDGYGGPAPPPNHGVHRYFFWVLALDKDLQLEPGLTLEQFLQQVEPHVIGMNRCFGTYEAVERKEED